MYDSTYCRVMTIAVCDMQLEDAAVQMILWKNLNVVMARHDVLSPIRQSSRDSWRIVRRQIGMVLG